MANKEPEALRIVLIGKTGAGKTSTMNTFLGRPPVKKNPFGSDKTPCKSEEVMFGNQRMFFVDTPGLCHTSKKKEEVLSEITASISQPEARPGPHVFLYVHKWGNGFTEHDEKRVEVLQKIFGEKSMCYFFPLITHVDGDVDKDEIREFLEKVGFKPENHCVIDNKQGTAKEQAHELVKAITQMVERNNWGYYTEEMFKTAQEALRKDIKEPVDPDPDLLTSAAMMLLKSLLGDTIALQVIQANTWLAEKFDEWIGGKKQGK